jgi:3-oxoacyl-[acyl-carrier protein] reductase
MDLWLRHKRVCVTGATSGIGLAIANAFALEGCDIALCGPEPERIDSAVAALRKKRVRVFGEPLSRQNVAAVGPWIDRMSRALGRIDILVVM